MAGESDIDALIAQEDYQPINDQQELIKLVEKIIAEYPQQAAEYKAGKEKLLAFFVGKLMKETKGQADPEQINTLIKQKLS